MVESALAKATPDALEVTEPAADDSTLDQATPATTSETDTEAIEPAADDSTASTSAVLDQGRPATTRTAQVDTEFHKFVLLPFSSDFCVPITDKRRSVLTWERPTLLSPTAIATIDQKS